MSTNSLEITDSLYQQKVTNGQNEYEVLEKELEDGLARHEIQNKSQLSEEIEDRKTQITALEKKGQTKKALERKNSLEDLEHLQSISKKIETLKSPGSDTKNKEIETLEKELEDGLARHEIQNKSQLLEEIEDRKTQITALEKKGQTKKALERKNSLEDLEHLQSISKKIETLKSPGSDTKNKEIETLEKELEDGLARHEIQNKSQLSEEIEDRKTQITALEKKGQTKKALERKNSLEDLEHLQSISKKIETLKSPGSDTKNKEIETLEKELEDGLARHEIQNKSQLSEEIEDRKIQITALEKKGQTKKALERKNSLEDLEHLQSISKQLLDRFKSAVGKIENQKDPNQVINPQEMKPKTLSYNDQDLLYGFIPETNEKIMFKEHFVVPNNDCGFIVLGASRSELVKSIRQYRNDPKKRYCISDEIQSAFLSEELDPPIKLREQWENLNKAYREEQQKLDELVRKIRNVHNDIPDGLDVEKLINYLSKKGIDVELLLNQKAMLESLDEKKKIYCSAQEIFDHYLESLENTPLWIGYKTALLYAESKAINLYIWARDEQSRELELIENYRTDNAKSQTIHMLHTAGFTHFNLLESIDHELIKEKTNNVTVELSVEKRKNNLVNMYKDYSSMPICSERIIMNLIYYSSLKLLDKTAAYDKSLFIPDQIEKEIEKEFDSLKNFLKMEELDSKDVKMSLQQTYIKVKSEDWSSAALELEKLLKKIRPLNIQEMSRLIIKTNEAADLVRDQDVILFLGGTGAGKSTTIHFLAGSKMVETEVEVKPGKFLKHISPAEPIKNPALRNVTISSRAESETRYITPVPVNFKDIGGYSSGGIILCDAPGFGDTAGPEVDIANGIGIIEAIKGCKSVRPVVLASALSVGDRGEGIKKLAHLLVGMVSGIQDKLGAFSYVFTKYPPECDIHVSLLNIKESVDKNPEEKSDKSFMALFEDMLVKTEDGAKRIDPIKDKPAKILNELVRSAAIYNPKETFQFSITENSKSAIQEQVRIHQLSIISATKRADYVLVKYKLDELKYLKDVLKQEFIKQIYADCVSHVTDALNKKYSETVSSFNRCLENQNTLMYEDIEQYQSCIKQIEASENLREFHLGRTAVQSSALIQNLITKVDLILQGLKDFDLNEPSVKISLDNIKLIAVSFKDVIPKYKEVCQFFNNQLDKLIKSTNQLISSNQFTQVAEVMAKVHRPLSLLGEHLDFSEIDKGYKSIAYSLLNHLREVSNVDLILKKEKIEENDLLKLKEAVSILESAKDTVELRDHLRIEEIKAINDSLVLKIVNYFESINNKVGELFRNEGENSFKEIEMLVKDMDAIRTIPGIDSKTSESYHRSIQDVLGYMQQLRRDAEQLLASFHEQKENVNYSRIFRCLSGLKNAEWMNRLRPGVYADVMKNITEDLVKHAQKLQENILDIDLDLIHFSNIEKAYGLVQQIDSMRPFEQNVPELTQYRENAHKRFEGAIQKTFDYIQETFNLQNKAVYQQKQMLQNLENIRAEYDTFHPAHLYLRDQGYEMIDALNGDIIRVENEQKDFIIQVEYEKNDTDSQLQHLNAVAKKYAELSSQKVGYLAKTVDLVKDVLGNNQSESDKLLQEVGCKNVSELYKNIEEKEKQILKLRDPEYVQQFLRSLEKLNSIKIKYHEILNVKDISPKAEEFLQKKGYQSIQVVDREIKRKKQEIAENESQGQDYVFSRIEGNTTEDALQYVDSCRKVRSIREIAQTTVKHLQNFIAKYSDFVQAEMQSCFSKVNNPKFGEMNDIFGYAQRLANRLQELSELEKFPTVFALLKGKEIVQHWRTTLSSHLIVLTDQMYQDSLDKKDVRSKLDIAKALSQLDAFVDNKYYDLYRHYQTTVSNEFRKVYKQIMDFIESHDYASVGTELLQIDDNPINERALSQIKHMLSASVTELVEKTKTKAIMLGNNLEIGAVQSIVDNLNKIESAKKHISGYFDKHVQEKFKTEGYLDEIARSRLDNGFKEVETIVSKKILRYLESIEALISVNDFYEAEEKREYINQIRHLLGNYCVTEEITDKIEKLQDILEGIVDKVLELYTNMPVSDYILNPPKYILDKLQKVASRSLKYTQSLNKIKENLIENVRKILKEAKEAIPDERNEHLQIVESALWALPEDIKKALEVELDNFKKFIANKEKNYESDYNRVITSGDIKVVYRFMERCSKDGMHSFLRLVQEEILKQGREFKDRINQSLDEENVKAALEQAKKLFEYKEVFGKNISEIENSYTDIQSQLSNKFNKLCGFILNIATVENNELIEKSFEDFAILVDFKNEFSSKLPDMFPAIDEKIENLYLKLSEYFIENQQKYERAIMELNIPQINESMNVIKKWNTLLKKIKRYSEIHNSDYVSVVPLCKIVEGCKFYPDTVTETSYKLRNLKNEVLSFELVDGYEKQRDEFYKDFEIKLTALRQVRELKDHVNNDIYGLNSYDKECLPTLKNKLERITSLAVSIIEKPNLTRADYNDFRLYYDNLFSFEKYGRTSGLDIKRHLEDIQQKVAEKLARLQSTAEELGAEVTQVANSLIEMKALADNIPSFKEKINEQIDEVLKGYRNKNKEQGGLALAKLGTMLEQDPSGIGLIIISEHKCFKGQAISLFNQETQRHDINYVLSKLEGDGVDLQKLRECYDWFDYSYRKILKEYISRLEKKQESEETIMNELISKTKLVPTEIPGIKSKFDKEIRWDSTVSYAIPNLMVHVFALWTLKNTEYYNEMKGVSDRDSYLLQPHPGQVVSILRMLGIGYGKKEKIEHDFWDKVKKVLVKIEDFTWVRTEGLKNNLVQIGTGEGKSVTLAVTASILALLGVDVSCACYSEYLSTRDYQSFLPIFDALGVTEHIHYGTFNKICENIINEQGDVRNRVVDLIVNNPDGESSVKISTKRPKILLIDEVDVFFSKEFYGNVYTPLARLKDPAIAELTNFIWKNRNSKLTLRIIESTSEYKACCNRFKGWEFLIKEAVKDMLADLVNFKHDYLVHNDKIAYKEQDGISYDVVYGYKTLFAYYHENEQGKISKNSLDENISVGIRCGSFSYAEMPHRFQYIMGVTGTLKTLSLSERNIVEKIYDIRNNTYMPSVFGDNKRQFAKEADVLVENNSDYFNRLREKIDYKIGKGKSKRAVLVFFENKEKLMEFYLSKNLAPIKSDVQIITEEVSSSPKEKDLLIKRATTSGQITLLTRVFGRGTDFVCRDQNVITNGGVHVIQTFFSEEFSEEVQIMGRTARQGKDGSYGMVLLDEDLEKFLGPSFKDDIEHMREGAKFYDTLDKKRNEFFDQKYSDTNEYVRKAEKEHNQAQKFIESLNNDEIEFVRQFLGERNVGAAGNNDSRTICLMDATGSMGHLLNQAKNTVGTMFERASVILKEHGIPSDSFQMQFAVYRDYDRKIEGVLQTSPWETKPDNLRSFMEKISASGGGDYEEAIEIGLWHANQENEKEEISQVILIGDAPAKAVDQIKEYRKSYGGEEYWKNSKFKQMTFYKDELQKLKNNNIPVHAFYLDNGARSNFEEIARETGGKCESLNINSSMGSDILTNVVTEQILNSIGQARGKGDELVNAYRSKFSKSYK